MEELETMSTQRHFYDSAPTIYTRYKCCSALTYRVATKKSKAVYEAVRIKVDNLLSYLVTISEIQFRHFNVNLKLTLDKPNNYIITIS